MLLKLRRGRFASWASLPLVTGLSSCTPTHVEPRREEAATPPIVPVAEPAVVAAEPAAVEPEPPKPTRQARPATIAASNYHVCAIEGRGQVACWGDGREGQLAPGIEGHRASPTRVPGIDDAAAVAVARGVSCALRAAGSITCWGRVDVGVIRGEKSVTSRALGEVVEFVVADRARPVVCGRRGDGTVACGSLPGLGSGATEVIEGIGDAVGIELHADTTYVLKASGELVKFSVKEVGAPKTSVVVERVEGLGQVLDIAADGAGLCATLASGEMKCRGYRDEWRPEVPKAGPLWKAKIPGPLWAGATDYSGTAMVHCMRDREQVVSCWGDNSIGQLGTGTPAYTVTPRVLFEGPSVAVNAGGATSCVVREGGDIACFEQAVVDPEIEVEGVRALAVGQYHSCAIVGGGEARCWGFSDTGALGTTGSPDGLVRVPGLSDLALVAVGEDHSCAARRDHSLRCWGLGSDGQLGDGRLVARDEPESDEGAEEPSGSPTPLLVEGIEGELVGLALGANFSCAATSVGLHCWGGLPNPSASDEAKVARPRLVLAGAPRAIDARDGSLCAIDGEGKLHCWGTAAESYRGGRYVKVSDGRDDDHPEAFSRGGPLWELGKLGVKPTAVAVGSAHACLLSETGEVSCWGSNEEGQLGDGTIRDSEVPVEVRGLPGPAVQIAAGHQHTCARVEDGRVLCWGSHTAAREHGRSATPVAVVGLAPRANEEPPGAPATP